MKTALVMNALGQLVKPNGRMGGVDTMDLFQADWLIWWNEFHF